MTSVCGSCKTNINKRNAPGLQCAGSCQKFFHASCAGLTKEVISSIASQNMDWFCSTCKKKNKRTSLVILDAPSPNIEFDRQGPFSSTSNNENGTMNGFMAEIRNAIKDFKCQQSEMLTSISFFSESFDNIMAKLSNFESKIVILDKLQNENFQLKKQLREQSFRITTLEQSYFNTQVDIRGVPDSIDIAPLDIVKTIASKIEFKFNENDINFCHRATWAAKNKPKDIFLSFKSNDVKDTFLSLKKKNNGVATDIFGASTHCTPIYINESLCSENKKLLYNAKQFAKNAQYKFVWVRDGKIHIRKDERSRFIIIKDTNTLYELENTNNQ